MTTLPEPSARCDTQDRVRDLLDYAATLYPGVPYSELRMIQSVRDATVFPHGDLEAIKERMKDAAEKELAARSAGAIST
jgi:hypothetical protein